jgi:hypothetical protein
MTPSQLMRRGKSRQNKAKNSSNYVGKQHFVDSNTSSGSAFRVRVADDMTRAPVAPDVSRIRMPKNMQTQIHWFQTTFQLATALTSNNITESNIPFSLSQTALSSNLAALFDQYAIFACYVRTFVTSSSVTNTFTQVFTTALDYDNTGNLGSQATLLGYSTAATTSTAEVQERYLEPCNAPALYSGATFTHYGQARMWVDSANTSTPHYGHRCIVANLGTSATGVVTFDITMVICARNVV